MRTLAVEPAAGPVVATVRVPGSKSITNRALVLAALAEPGEWHGLSGVLRSEDTEVMIECLRRLGFELAEDWPNATVRVRNPTGRIIPAASADLDCANSGTTMRFLSAMLALGHGDYRLDGVPRMRERPIGDLLGALRQLGVEAVSESGGDCPPVRIRARGLKGGAAGVRASLSSQFLSGLLLAAPRAAGPIDLALEGERVSEPYVAMTLSMLRDWGAGVAETPAGFRVTPSALRPPARPYAVEPDASAASYFFALAAITGGRVTVTGLDSTSLQGDIAFVRVLEAMGCRVSESGGATTVGAGARLAGGAFDLNAISDTAMTLAAVACFAEGPTAIENVAHIRHKETDRLAALATELRKVGVAVAERPAGLTITPPPGGVARGATFATYRDHRMAMSLALLGARAPGVVIEDPDCVGKTYPEYWADLGRAMGSK